MLLNVEVSKRTLENIAEVKRIVSILDNTDPSDGDVIALAISDYLAALPDVDARMQEDPCIIV
jgi:hypothetical protein